MAKGARSSVMKRNKAKLRATVFGPVVDLRTERLSAKLQELASKPKEETMADADFEITEKSNASETAENDAEKGMDIDEPTKSSATEGQSHRIQKRVRRKTRPSITFAAHPQKAKRNSKKK
ncbi:hypothetical protein FQN55_007538 [Onygenales sp. PD_40]|nr:hypothetical protein FQN55_007538 [Onygenales sp. PD_40]KAK2767898.1 hypothetical protein FQN53_006438 [Emmonsiellopsis sp. PD_33]KAK2794950.1 hypothetical protein FQN52_006829 [Onygenales sp. PD_12]KAK2797592.1 hypothetical protein FQN51_008387 [Onygenales sp. PD_10]